MQLQMPCVSKEVLLKSPTPPVRILLVDDHTIVRAGLRLLIESQPTLIVVGEAGTAGEALAATVQHRPDVILLDLKLGVESGLDLLPKLFAVCDRARVLILTGVTDADTHKQAARLGAMGLVLKEKPVEVLIKAIDRVHHGEIWFDRLLMGDVMAGITRARSNNGGSGANPDALNIATLTERERQVVTLIGEGLKNKALAERLFISETTVRHHLSSVFSKLNVSDRLELVIYAYRHGLADPPSARKH